MQASKEEIKNLEIKNKIERNNKLTAYGHHKIFLYDINEPGPVYLGVMPEELKALNTYKKMAIFYIIPHLMPRDY